MRIEVRRTGGFAGIERRAGVDTSDLPDADVWHRLVGAALPGATARDGAAADGTVGGGTADGGTVGRGSADGGTADGGSGGGAAGDGPCGDGSAGRGAGVPDGFHYEITVDGRTAHCAEPDLTDAQRELVSRVLREGA